LSDPGEPREAEREADAAAESATPVDDPQRHADKYSDPRVRITGRGIAALVAIGVIGVVVAFASIAARRTRLEKTTEFWGLETITALQLADQVHLVVPNPAGNRVQTVDGESGRNGEADAAERSVQSEESEESKKSEEDASTGLQRIELTALPGLGHLRKALLDERHYDWSTLREDSGMAAWCAGKSVDGATGRPEMPAEPERIAEDVGPDSDHFDEGGQSGEPECVELQLEDPTYERVGLTRIAIDLSSGFVGPAEKGKRVRLNERVRPALRHQLKLLMNFQQKRYDERARGTTP